MEYPNQMTKQESKKLFIEYKKTGDKEIRDRLIENFLYIPKLLVKKYAYRSNDVEDIYQVACLGLMYAVERYDPDRGFEFDTFASPTIIGEIKKYYRDKQWIIRVPRRIQELNREANTIGSKCQNADIAHVVVDLKAEIEKIREQIQNVE